MVSSPSAFPARSPNATTSRLASRSRSSPTRTASCCSPLTPRHGSPSAGSRRSTPCSSTTGLRSVTSPMSEGRGSGLIYPEYEQAVAFHYALLQRLGEDPTGTIDEVRLRSTLQRARQVIEQQRGDI